MAAIGAPRRHFRCGDAMAQGKLRGSLGELLLRGAVLHLSARCCPRPG